MMKKINYVLLFLLIPFCAFAQEVEKLPKIPWEEIVEINNNDYYSISKWKKNIYISLEGNYNKQDSLEIDRIIKKLDKLTETISIQFSADSISNFKIKFLNKFVYDKYNKKRVMPNKYSFNNKREIKNVELYLYLNYQSETDIRKSLESQIAKFLVNGSFPFYIGEFKRNSIFNTYTYYSNNKYVPLNEGDIAILSEVYKKGFKENLKIAEKLYKDEVLKNFKEIKVSKRDRNLWWVRNPIAIIILPAILFILFSIFIIKKVNTILVKKTNYNNWLRFLILILSIAFFVDIFIIFSVSTFDFLTIPDDYRKVPFMRKDTVFTTIVFSILSIPILFLIRFIELKIQEKVNSIFQKSVLIFISTGFLPFLMVNLLFLLTNSDSRNIQGGYTTLANTFVFLMIVAALRTLVSYFYFKERKLIVDNELKLSNLRELKTKAELKSLQSQINPHFLYNSLNSIASLAPIDAVKTQKMAHSLSDLFKYSINRKGQKMSTVKDEIEMVQAYLEIEKIRFEERLNFTIKVDETLLNHKIPLFLIQPLVENAIKHGVSKNKDKGEVVLKIEKGTNAIIIAVSDNGPDFPEGLVSGHGLQTVYDLLRLSYGDKASLNWTNTSQKMITITIPKTA